MAVAAAAVEVAAVVQVVMETMEVMETAEEKLKDMDIVSFKLSLKFEENWLSNSFF